MLNKVIAAGCVIFIALSAWSVALPSGDKLPLPFMALMVVALVVLLLGHMWKHLGWRLMAAFAIAGAVVEWIFEQTNISFGGFIWGDIRYGDMTVFSLHIGDVPLVVPLLMAVILWPTYATVNLALDGRIVLDPKSMPWWQTVWRCVLYGFVHSWLMLMFNELCENWDVYQWVGHSARRPAEDMFLGDPRAPLGWLIYVVVTMLIFSLVIMPVLGRHALAAASARPLAWADGAPIVFLGVLALQVALNRINNATVANVALWTMGFFAVLVGYRFADVMRLQRVRDQSW